MNDFQQWDACKDAVQCALQGLEEQWKRALEQRDKARQEAVAREERECELLLEIAERVRECESLRELRKLDAECLKERDEVRADKMELAAALVDANERLLEAGQREADLFRQTEVLQASLLKAHEEAQAARQDAVEFAARLHEARHAAIELLALAVKQGGDPQHWLPGENGARLRRLLEANEWLNRSTESGPVPSGT